MKLTDFKALTFDCYGTLIDWESGIVHALEPLTSKITPLLNRTQILEAHARHESEQQHWTPSMCYSTLLSIVYKRLAEEWGVSVSHEQCIDYGESVRDWPAFEDSKASLQYLKQHYELIILSNVDNLNFEGSNNQLGVEFDAIYTAEDIGSYKPSDRNFNYMLEKLKSLGLNRSDVLHTAESMFHDHVPAKRHGLANCWIYRRHAQEGFGATMDPGSLAEVDFQFNSMAELVKAHQQISEPTDLYCQLYVNYDKDDLAEIVAQILDVSKDTDEQVEHELLNALIVPNKDDDLGSEMQSSPEFMLYPHLIEIEPAQNVEEHTYVEVLANLIRSLREKCGEVVAACEFEERLP